MQSKKETVFCTQCGAQIPPGQAVCPYCGSAYAPEAERAYMRRLHQLQKDLDRVGDAGAAEAEKETRRLGRRITLILGIILSFSAILCGIFFCLQQKKARENRAEYLWEKENIPALDTLFAEGKYDELADAFGLAREEGHSLYDWEHYDFCTLYEKIPYIDEALKMYGRGIFHEADAAVLLYDLLYFKGMTYRSRMPAADKEILEDLFAPYRDALDGIYPLSGDELADFEQGLKKSGGYPDLAACEAFVRNHPEILSK